MGLREAARKARMGGLADRVVLWARVVEKSLGTWEPGLVSDVKMGLRGRQARSR